SAMPMIRPASMTSRKTTMSAPSMNDRLFHDQHALGGLRMIVTEEIIFARRKRGDAHRRLGLAGDDFLDPQRLALELLRRRIEILDRQRDRLAGRRMQLSGIEAMILDLEAEARLLGESPAREGSRGKEGTRGGEFSETSHEAIFPWLSALVPRTASFERSEIAQNGAHSQRKSLRAFAQTRSRSPS